MDADTSDLSKLSARDLLLKYRTHLPSGAYFYIDKDEDARPEDIMEIPVPLGGQSIKSGHGVVFGFFEKGCPPTDLTIKDFPYWLHRYPFSHHITSPSSEFQKKLASHIRARLLNVHELAGTRRAAER
jgi:hypothetical protein